MSERRQAAWDEAQRRYPTRDRQAGFVAGAAWADALGGITADQCNDIEDAVHEGVPLGHLLRRLGIEVRDE